MAIFATVLFHGVAIVLLPVIVYVLFVGIRAAILEGVDE